MDSTHDPRQLLEELRAADPSDSPDPADRLAERLSVELEDDEPESAGEPSP